MKTYKQKLEQRLPKSLDRRIKMTDEIKEGILKDYERNVFGYERCAKKYGVSKKSVILFLNPDIKSKNAQQRKERWAMGMYRPEKEKRAKTMREHRRYKVVVIK